ncbi:sensor histidine kinase [Halosegnis rubeus]|uniref:histidine kinase n=1 Tax=Halosegnis rubeus TaxID=2212850 RepID=A0A5N5U710_9EURY|nr:ATP-binding protein [Halosegnis rubeus]KAB7514344.1 PAS domain S-box protein [Halosegnis rubeus]
MTRGHQRVPFPLGGIISLLGVLLASVVVYDLYADIVVQNNRPLTALLENSLPLALNAGIIASGFWLTQHDNRDISKQAVIWTGISITSLLLLAVWVYSLQLIQGQLKPLILLAQIASMGAVAGIVVGVYSGRQNHRQRELQSLFQNSRDCIAKVQFENETPLIQEVNPAFESMFGYTTDDAAGESLDELIVDSQSKRQATELSRRARGGEQFETEVTRTTASGDSRIFRLQALPIDTGRTTTHVYAVYTDITDSKRHTKRVNALHSATRELISAETPEEVAQRGIQAVSNILELPLSSIFAERAGTLEPVASSEAAKELFDEIDTLDPEKSVAWRVYESGQPVKAADITQVETIQNPQTPIASEMILPLSEYGVLIIGDTEAGEFDDEDFTLAQILGDNISTSLNRVDREQRLRAREQELREQNERLETFTSVVSHDLQNPLSVATGYTELAQQESGETEALEKVEQALERMNSLIDELLTLAQQGESIDEKEPILLDRVASKAWETAATEQATLEIIDDGQFNGDRNRIQQLLENLFRNAVEHGGASVTVTVGAIDSDGFYVEDDGPGIPADTRETVFDHGYTTSETGTGFGLPIVNEIVEAHGGTISVLEGHDGGARFEIRDLETSN